MLKFNVAGFNVLVCVIPDVVSILLAKHDFSATNATCLRDNVNPGHMSMVLALFGQPSPELSNKSCQKNNHTNHDRVQAETPNNFLELSPG